MSGAFPLFAEIAATVAVMGVAVVMAGLLVGAAKVVALRGDNMHRCAYTD